MPSKTTDLALLAASSALLGTATASSMSSTSIHGDFYTSDDYYVASVPEFGQPAVYIRDELARIGSTGYASSHAFNTDLFDLVNGLNDVDGAQDVYVVPDLVDFISLLGIEYTSYSASLGFGWARLRGVRVVRPPRVLRFGDLAGPLLPDLDNLTMEVILANGTEPETVVMPYLAGYLEETFTDASSYPHGLIRANAADYSIQGAAAARETRAALAAFNSLGVGIPSQWVSNLTAIYGEDIMWRYILRDNKSGVMSVGSLEPEDYYHGFY
ncbi:uncharacterized protein C8Q71DRAFT_724906 [Rhodofomes roseus]|uniref:Uncharacterized protein n=1 Tax=Rhodofomes roseus TaxID=34475 RepID=A0ABQ8KCK5_9APHY|nr:uncharacterized protein C8Q71DRAFT_724906 [Rhodofomes roseus]KAH9834939.1 hypothetical protein C8Q71DRAFT_724906 [Rhodofomes roseus]